MDLPIKNSDFAMLVYQRVCGAQGHGFTDDIWHRPPDVKPVATWRAGDHPARELRKRLAGRLHRWGGLATACERVPMLGLGRDG